jgi:hypothetical protein
MPVTRDGMFLQVWNGPGEAKLLFIPHGKFIFPTPFLHTCFEGTQSIESQGKFLFRKHEYVRGRRFDC